MNEKKLMNKEDSLWIADNLLMNYCLWDDDALMIESFVKNLKIPLVFDVNHFHFCITGLDKKFTNPDSPTKLSQGVQITNDNYRRIQTILKNNHYKGNAFLIKVDNSKKIAIIFSEAGTPLCPPEQLAMQFHQIDFYLGNKYQRYLTTSLVSDCCGYESLHTAYIKAKELNLLSFFTPFDEIVTDELIAELSLDCSLSSIDENTRKLRNLMCTASIHEINAQVDRLFLNLIANSYNYTYFSAAYLLCELIINSFIKVYGLKHELRMRELTTYNSLEEYVIDLKTKIAKILTALQGRTLYSSRILAAIDFIKDNYRKDLSLKNIAEFLSVNPTSLSSEFNSEVHQSISDYISQCRIDAACSLLVESEESIASIAKWVGFTNAKYFSSVFHELKEMTPLQYRKTMKVLP